MSFQEEKRNSIKRYLLEKIRNEDIEYNIKTIENFGVSITTVRRYIKELLEQGILEENIEKRCGYQLVAQEYCFSYNTSDYLNEDKIYRSDIWPVIEKLSTNAKDIWMYAFTEMMNNAIEHAKAKNIRCRVIQDALYTEISIADDGIGIFKNIIWKGNAVIRQMWKMRFWNCTRASLQRRERDILEKEFSLFQK